MNEPGFSDLTHADCLFLSSWEQFAGYSGPATQELKRHEELQQKLRQADKERRYRIVLGWTKRQHTSEWSQRRLTVYDKLIAQGAPEEYAFQHADMVSMFTAEYVREGSEPTLSVYYQDPKEIADELFYRTQS